MSIVKQIVVGTDFSPHSRRAVAYAGELAKALDADLVVVHVDEKAAFVPGSDLALDEAVADRTNIDAVVHDLVGSGVRARGVVRPGLPTDGVLAVAREVPADLIVVGMRDRSRFADAVLGSVSEHVVREAPCPVVVFRHTPGR
jgi:nucleotide-binding universal stress UspA family protein